jgi:hypothetical protein
MNPTSELHDKEPVFLASEDRNRMSRLYEEVWIRLEEMAMIMSRSLKMEIGREREVCFCPLESEQRLEFEAVELVRTPRGRGWYDYRRGLCFESDGPEAADRPSEMTE